MLHPHKLYCPFPSEMNKHVAIAQQHTAEWVKKFDLVRSQTDKIKFESSNFPLLAARTFPYADLEGLLITSDWNTWLFLLDDQCDRHQVGKSTTHLRKTFDQLIEVIQKDKFFTLKDGSPLSASLSDFWIRIQDFSPDNWKKRFAKSVEEYLDACIWEANNREQNQSPNVEEYMLKRLHSGAVYTDFDLIELTEGFVLPNEVIEHSILKNLTDYANRIICWTNDILSYSIEQQYDDVHNLVLAIHYQENMSLQQAETKAIQIYDDDIKKYIELEKNLPSFGKELDQQVDNYLRTVRTWMRGYIDWCSYDTRRFDQ